jgi:spoIIIJ-associated protein
VQVPTSAEGHRRVALRIEVDEQRLAPLRRRAGGQVDGGGRLSDPALLVRDGVDLAHRVQPRACVHRRVFRRSDSLPPVSESFNWPDNPAERAQELVEGVLDELDLDGEVVVDENDERILLTVEGEDDYGLLIGKRGQTIDALQLLCYQAAFRGLRERKRVVLDAAGYRARRRETLEGRADRAAEQALTNNRVVEMDPMSAQERRVVHERLKERAGVETYSEGDEPHRCVVVAPLVSE